MSRPKRLRHRILKWALVVLASGGAITYFAFCVHFLLERHG